MTEQIDRLALVSRVMFEQRIIDLQHEKLELQKRVMELEYSDIALNSLLAMVNDTGLTEVCVCSGCYCAKRFGELEPEELVIRLSNTQTNHDLVNQECLLKRCLIWQCEQVGLSYQTYTTHGETDSELEEGVDIGNDTDSLSRISESSEDEETDSDSKEENRESDPMSEGDNGNNTHDDNLSYDSNEDDWSALDCMAIYREKAQRLNCHVVIVDKGCGTWGVVYGRKLKDMGLLNNPDADKLKALFELVKDGERFFKVDGKDYFDIADNRQS